MFFTFLFVVFINCSDTKDSETEPKSAQLTAANLQLHNSRDNTEETHMESDQYSETGSRASSKRSSFDRKISKRSIAFATGKLGPEETAELSDKVDGSPRKKKGVKRLKEPPAYRELEDPVSDEDALPIAPRTSTPMPKDEVPAEQEPEVVSEDGTVEPSDPGTAETNDTESETENPDDAKEKVDGTKARSKARKEPHNPHKQNSRNGRDKKDKAPDFGPKPKFRRREMPEYVRKILFRKNPDQYDDDEENDADDEEFAQEE